MRLAEQVTQHLPYMRRFARALCGSQAGGDAYVVSVLETLLAAPDSLDPELDVRTALYKLLLKMWNSVRVNQETAPTLPAGRLAVDRSLDAITPKPRQAFLLVAMEEFKPSQAAAILEVSEAELKALMTEASRQIAAQVATDVLIIEDEPLIAIDLESIMASLGHRILGVARTRKEALAAVKERQPGLVLADIQLADGSSGIDAVNDLLKSFRVPVIFITSYPERLLTGQRPEPAFLITKPFQNDMVKVIAAQALFFDQKASLQTA